MMNFKIIILSVLCALWLTSCTNDDNTFLSSAQVAVAISVTLPQQEEVATRAHTDTDIKNMTVLVFDHVGKFMERIDVDASDLTLAGNGAKFSIILDATAENRTLHLIANARTDSGTPTDRINLTGLSTTQTEAQIIPHLVANEPSTTGENALLNAIDPLIMWGRVSMTGVTITSKVDDAKLLRSVACIRVKKGSATTENGLNDFTISKFAIHNAAGRGYVAPVAYSSSVTTTPTMGNPYSITAYDYTKAWSEVATEPLAYTYERDCTDSNYMSIILAATYNGKAGYYKIALTNSSDAAVNILRNHRYTITILSVNGPGYSDAAIAANAAPANNELLKVQINVDDSNAYPFLIADSQYWMGLSNNVFQLIGSSSGASTSNIELCTVYSSRGLTPVVTNAPTGLAISVTGSGNIYKVTGTFTNGTSISNHAITISCDNLSLPLDVQWTNAITSYAGCVSDADSYVLDLASSLSNWKIWIPDPATNSMVHLHPTASQAGALSSNAGSGMLTELAATYYGHAYLHIHKSTGRKDEVGASATAADGIVVRKTIIAQ